MKRKVEKRLLNLAIGEFAAAWTFVLLYTVLELGMASLVALVLLDFILVQGSFYWLVRYRSVKRRKDVPVGIVRFLKVLRDLDLILLFGEPIALTLVREDARDFSFAWFIYLFAIVEYVNYYWYRLSYGKSGFNIRMLMENGLKESSLKQLLRKGE